MSELAKKLMKKNADSRLKIESYTEILNMPIGEPWDAVKALYNSKRLIDRLLGTLLNGVATEKKQTFILSKKIFGDMVDSDPNIDRSTVNGDEFNTFMSTQQQNGTLACENPPTKFSPSNGKKNFAGTYKIIDKDFLKTINIDCSSSLSTQDSTQTPTELSPQDPLLSSTQNSSLENENENETEHESEVENEYNKIPSFSQNSNNSNNQYYMESSLKVGPQEPIDSIDTSEQISTSTPLKSTYSDNYTVEQFIKFIKILGIDEYETADYFSKLIKHDINHSVGFIQIEELIYKNVGDVNKHADAVVYYRNLFQASRCN